jgi:uncharacterized protein
MKNQPIEKVKKKMNSQSPNSKIVLIDKILRTQLEHTQGLMFSKKRTLLFIFSKPMRVPIHMFFVFFPIWAIWLDADKVIIDIKKAKPFMPYISHEGKATYLLEIPFTTSDETKPFRIGQKLNWKVVEK